MGPDGPREDAAIAQRRADDLRKVVDSSSQDAIRRVFRLDGTETWRDVAARLTVAGEVLARLAERVEKLEKRR